jgi:hypothetical protein
MTIAQRLTKPPMKRVRCGVGRILDTLSTEDRAALTAALDDPKFTTTGITAAIRAEGHRTSYTVVRVHRTGACCCGLR